MLLVLVMVAVLSAVNALHQYVNLRTNTEEFTAVDQFGPVLRQTLQQQGLEPGQHIACINRNPSFDNCSALWYTLLPYYIKIKQPEEVFPERFAIYCVNPRGGSVETPGRNLSYFHVILTLEPGMMLLERSR